MISVLICSINPDLLIQVKQNIEKTIGVEHEILYYDNRKLNNGICFVYNTLATKAKFPYLCFVHEDVLFQTNDWGKKILEIFSNDKQIGLIGIAGCKYKSKYFSGWFSNSKELDCANYIHQYSDRIEKVCFSPNNNKLLEEVVCIDGVFMCSTKEAWNKNKFNDKLLTGFHFYDIDFSLNVANSYKVVVTFDVELIHITSGGDFGNKWVIIAMNYHEQMNKNLPFAKTPINKKIADGNIIIGTLDFLKNYNISFINKIKWIVLQKLYFNPKYYYGILKFILYKPLGLKKLHKLYLNRK